MNNDRYRDPAELLLDEYCELGFAELCRACHLSADEVHIMVEEGIIDPLGGEPAQWRFKAVSIGRVRRARRLEQDLGVNLAGVALALDLLDEVERLRARVRRIEKS